jgi:hypothetical protein
MRSSMDIGRPNCSAIGFAVCLALVKGEVMISVTSRLVNAFAVVRAISWPRFESSKPSKRS